MGPEEDGGLLDRLLRGGSADRDDPSWVRAFDACAKGRFSDTLAIVQREFLSAEGHDRARLACSAGSALRQMGRHVDAEVLESQADRCCGAHAAHLMISGVANAVGSSDPRSARYRLDAATEAASEQLTGPEVDEIGTRRVQIRLAWVGSEVELMHSSAEAALEWLISAIRALSEGPSWPRHIAKTHMFTAVCLRELGRFAASGEHLDLAEQHAISVGAVPLLDVCRTLRSDGRASS